MPDALPDLTAVARLVNEAADMRAPDVIAGGLHLSHGVDDIRGTGIDRETSDAEDDPRVADDPFVHCSPCLTSIHGLVDAAGPVRTCPDDLRIMWVNRQAEDRDGIARCAAGSVDPSIALPPCQPIVTTDMHASIGVGYEPDIGIVVAVADVVAEAAGRASKPHPRQSRYRKPLAFRAARLSLGQRGFRRAWRGAWPDDQVIHPCRRLPFCAKEDPSRRERFRRRSPPAPLRRSARPDGSHPNGSRAG